MISALFEYLNQRFETLPKTSLHYRWLIITVFLLSTAFMLFNIATKFNMDMSLETMFKESDPARVTLDNFRHRFGSDDGLYIVYEAADGDVFSEKSIATIAKLHQELDDARVARGDKVSELNRIDRIDSLYNVRLQKVEGDTLISQKLLATDFPKTQEEREAKRNIALKQDIFRLAYFSDDYRFGGIRIKTNFGTIPKKDKHKTETVAQDDLLSDDFAEDFGNTPSGDLVYDSSVAQTVIKYETTQMDEYLSFMKDVRTITEKPEYKHFKFHYSGNAAMMEFAAQTVIQGGGLIAGMVLVFIFLLWFLFRSFSAVVWSISVIAFSTIWAVGFFSFIGVTMSNLVMLTVMLIMAVGVASCIHILSTYGIYRKEGREHAEALSKTYRQTGVPIILTSVTTMAGMGSLVVSDMPQLTTFGLLSAFGVFVAFFIVILVLPICLEYWRPYANIKNNAKESDEKEVNRHWLKPLLDRIPSFVEKHSIGVAIFYLFALVIFGYGTLQVKVDTNMIESTRPGSMIRVAAETIDAYMMGGQTMEVVLDFGKANAIKDPEILKAIEGFQKHVLATYPKYMVKSFSIADYVKETNKAMNEDRDEFKVIPDDPRMTAQLLYMFNNSNSEDRRNLVSDDYSTTHITIQLKNAGSYEYTDIFKEIDKDINERFGAFSDKYENTKINSTGTLPLMMKLLDKMSWAQIRSFGLAIIIISLFLILSLNSFKGGLISMLPNILPSISTFGIMGLLGIPLNTDILIVAPLIIGIAVDDTIHFMSHYRDAWFRTGDMRESLKETIFEVGQAVTFTTIILACGFGVLIFSDFLGLANIGKFSSLAILIALSCDLILLPASIVLLKPDLGRKAYIAGLNKKTA